MESSSESFLWSDASNDSIHSRQFVGLQTMGNASTDVSGTGVNCKEAACDSILTNNYENNENETQKRKKKSKKRKHSETTQESSDFSHPGRKKIKLEPESDIDAGKKKKSNKSNNICNNEPQDATVYHQDYLDLRVKEEQLSITVASDVEKPKKKKKQRNSDFDKNDELSSLEISKSETENYLDLRVKEEQASLVKTKMKKQIRSNSYTDDGDESKSALGENMESYLDVSIKEEQASLVEPGIRKSKRNKKHRSSVISHEMDTTNGTNSLKNCDDTTDVANSPQAADETEYSVIEDKFSAEETVIEKPRKKKHKKESVSKNSDVDNDNIFKDKRVTITEERSENMNDNDLSLQASDFTCNNIASSTVINNSAVDITLDEQKKKTEDLVRGRKKVSTKKISDRIRFEDDSSMQESVCSPVSAKINRFLKANPQLELYNPESQKQSLITKNDEIWALKWPHEIDVKKLKNTTLSLEGKYKIKIEGNIYEGVPSAAVNRLTLFVHQDGQALVTNLAVNECVDYHKRIPKPHIPDSNIMVNNQTNFILLPETKCRHPLFGPHYKKSIKIPNAVVEHLEAAKLRCGETASETMKKKKRKKDKHKELDVKIEVDIKTEPLKKKKKRKHSGDEEPPHKPKRIKLEPNSTAVWESEQAIEENLFNF